jgi:asparagine synthase (glutamine-hydrolysing)
MCGFAGFLGASHSSFDQSTELLRRMGESIAHRGPDDVGIWSDMDCQIGLVHRRLSIVDLSPAGHQPMASVSGRYVIVFNGEVYNHRLLRAEIERVGSGGLAGTGWRGHSDTETLLAGFDAFGLEATLKKSVGMFAFALWDKQLRQLILARDRLGEKPLYYGIQNGILLFGSELKALKAHPAFAAVINRDALTLQMRHNYVPTPYSIYEGISKLPPGTFLRLQVGQMRGEPSPYWALGDVIELGKSKPFAGSDTDAVIALDTLLRDSVALQMQADVPLGAFLSGGVDSSTIVALMQTQSAIPVKTFTIGFNEEGYNEARYAKAVAKYLGTEHTELYVSPKQALDVIPLLPTLYDEPFSDSSQIPTFLVSQMTRQHVTVSLSGDGGDELFGGYGRYPTAARFRSRIPVGLRTFKSLGAKFALLIGSFDQQSGELWQQLHDLLVAKTNSEFYLPRVSHSKRPSSLVIGGREPMTVFTDSAFTLPALDFFQTMMALDTVSYLPDDILVKVDRAAMGVSLETRIPMLDHRIVEFAWSLPLHMKIRDSQGKWVLRQVLDKYVPKELIERPKMGFGVPIDSWLRGPLREWAESLLDESRLRNEGFFNSAPIRKKWNEHLSGQRNWQNHIWDVLMFQSWLEAQ